jgi:DNA-binding GntR family transcriptional regulator
MIERQHLRAALTEAIRERIVAQRLPANHSIGEVALAEELGVSRTPIREALFGLEHDGFVKAMPGRGFVVLPLSADEARQLYPIVWSLETLALSESAVIPPRVIAQLREINARLAVAATFQRTGIDAEWHRCLVSVSRNRRLLAMLDSVKASISRYEHAYLDVHEFCGRSIAEHEHVTTMLEQSLALGAEAIETHWRQGLETILNAIAAS